MRTSVEFSPSYAMLNVELDGGESIKAETGAMAAQQGVSMRQERAEAAFSAAYPAW